MKASGCEVELSRNRFTNQEAFVSHANAALTPRARLRLAQLIVEGGWTYAAAAKMFMVAPRTAKKWADRFRTEGALGMADRSSRPRVSPTRTGPEMVRQIIGVRWRHRLGPVQSRDVWACRARLCTRCLPGAESTACRPSTA
jgi:hypothetical protein